MVVPRARSGSRARMAARFQFPGKNPCATLLGSCRSEIVGQTLRLPVLIRQPERLPYNSSMRTFGGFRLGEEFFYGELRGDEVHRLAEPYWIEVRATNEVLPLASLQIDVPVAPTKLI